MTARPAGTPAGRCSRSTTRPGLVDFARGLHELGFELVSSGGTAAAIADAGIPVTPVADVTGVGEMLDHRVVTLHPKIHGGILADLGKESHRADLEAHGIAPFELVVSNLYPFHVSPDIETIDIGGPALTRAAAKNHAWVGIVTLARPVRRRPRRAARRRWLERRRRRRSLALDAFASHRGVRRGDRPLALGRRALASPSRVCARAHRRDAALRGEPASAGSPVPTVRDDELVGPRPPARRPRAELPQLLRRRRRVAPRARPGHRRNGSTGVRDHQARQPVWGGGRRRSRHRLPAGPRVRRAFGVRRDRRGEPAAGRGDRRAHGRRPPSRPGAGPGYAPGTIDALVAKRKNTRLLEAPAPEPWPLDVRQISGGFLVQDPHRFVAGRDDWRVVTKRVPTADEWRDAELAWRICGWVKSNSIVLVKDGQAVGIGAGQQNRVESGEIAAKKAAGRGRAARAPATRSTPSPTASRRRWTRGRGDRPARRGDARRGQHRTGRRARASPWSSPANATSSTDEKAAI